MIRMQYFLKKNREKASVIERWQKYSDGIGNLDSMGKKNPNFASVDIFVLWSASMDQLWVCLTNTHNLLPSLNYIIFTFCWAFGLVGTLLFT